MRKVALLNTAIFSFNQGDYIIMESAKKQLKDIVAKKFVVEIPTHAVPLHHYQYNKTMKKALREMNPKFVCGTNLLSKNMFKRRTTWNLNLYEAKHINNCVFLGVGAGNIGKINWYTKKLLKRALSTEYIHSVRDEEAKRMLESIGLKAINTGCVTLWNFDEEHCNKIPTKKSSKVVFTLTDYKKDKQKDQKLIDILNKNYEEVYFWVQGFGDLKYLNDLENTKNVQIIGSSVKEYTDFLQKNECDFIGTRLHAGIKAMQEFRRAIILIVDNRARSMKRDYNLNCIERENIDNELENYINEDFKTKVMINKKAIETWKKQFI